MKASLNIANTELEPSTEVRVLGVILDPALRWNPQIRAVEAKAASQIKALRSITGSTWGSSMTEMQRVYATVVRPSLTFGCNTWYTPKGLPGHRKGLVNKLQSIQGKCLRIAAGAYRATATEALEVETFTPPIDLYMETQVARTTLRLRSCKSRAVEEHAKRRIGLDERRGRGRPPKPPPTPGELRLRWVENQVGDVSNLEERQPYIRPPWYSPPQITIDGTKEEAIKRLKEKTPDTLRVFTDGSGIDGRLGAAAATEDNATLTSMGYTDDAQVYHAELVGVLNALHMLLTGNYRQALILSDSQAGLKAIVKANPSTAQNLLKSIYDAVDELTAKGVQVKFQWVPAHKGIEGNEKADKAAKLAANAIGPHKKPLTRFLSAVYPLVKRKVNEV
jgi:ribonuclease HI